MGCVFVRFFHPVLQQIRPVSLHERCSGRVITKQMVTFRNELPLVMMMMLMKFLLREIVLLPVFSVGIIAIEVLVAWTG